MLLYSNKTQSQRVEGIGSMTLKTVNQKHERKTFIITYLTCYMSAYMTKYNPVTQFYTKRHVIMLFSFMFTECSSNERTKDYNRMKKTNDFLRPF